MLKIVPNVKRQQNLKHGPAPPASNFVVVGYSKQLTDTLTTHTISSHTRVHVACAWCFVYTALINYPRADTCRLLERQYSPATLQQRNVKSLVFDVSSVKMDLDVSLPPLNGALSDYVIPFSSSLGGRLPPETSFVSPSFWETHGLWCHLLLLLFPALLLWSLLFATVSWFCFYSSIMLEFGWPFWLDSCLRL